MYENSPIKASLTASMMVLVESLSEAVNVKGDTAAKKIASVNKQLKSYVATVEAYEKQLSALRKNGFALAEIEKPQNVKLAEERISHAQDLIHNLRTLEAIEHLKFFGEHALLVRYDDFEKVMLAYDLRCTTLDRFTGQIPADKLNGLISVFDKMESLDEYWGKTINGLTYYSLSNSLFPFTVSCIKEHRLFIVAPESQITQKDKDPFVCAHTDYGILVLEKWGEEADHGIIRQYKKTPPAYWRSILQDLNKKALPGKKITPDWNDRVAYMEQLHQNMVVSLLYPKISTASRVKESNANTAETLVGVALITIAMVLLFVLAAVFS